MEREQLIEWLKGLVEATEKVEGAAADTLARRTSVAFLLGYAKSATAVIEYLKDTHPSS